MKSASSSRTLAFAVLVLSIVCLVLVSALIWRAFVYEAADTTPAENPMDLKWRFPGYFRTPEEQREFELIRVSQQSEPVSNVSTSTTACYQPCSNRTNGLYNTTTSSSSTTTSTSGYITRSPPVANGTAGRRRRDTDSTCELDELRRKGVSLTPHACCVSYATYSNSSFLPSANNPGQLLKIAQRIGNLHQYFQTEYCCLVSGCNICQCQQTYYIVSAVIQNVNVNNHFYTDLVRVPGCCKCVNRFS